MPNDTRTLIIMRHATAEQDGPSDAERRLSEPGTAAAAEGGRWLVARGVVPDAALVSAATRTQMTWESLSEAAGWDVEADLDEGLYAAGPATALDLIRETDPAVASLLVIGHNPTVAFLTQSLDDGEGDEEASTQMSAGFPAGALAVLSFRGEWADLDEASARVIAFHVARA